MADSGLFIDGEAYTTDDLTYREQRELRDLIRHAAPGEDVESAAEVDFIPAFITVVKKRNDPEFTFEQALEFKPSDLVEPEKPARPTKRATKS